MSFAPSKKHLPKESFDSMRHSRLSSLESPNNFYSSSLHTRASFDSDFSHRLDVLDSNMFRISQQQEALYPLTNMINMTPNFAKYDKLVHEIEHQNHHNEDRIRNIENLMDKYHSSLENSVHKINGEPKAAKPDFKFLESNIKTTVTQLNEKDKLLVTLKHDMHDFHNNLEKRIDHENASRGHKLDPRIDSYTHEFKEAVSTLHNSVNIGFGSLEDAVKDLYEKVEKFKKHAQTESKELIVEDIKHLIGKRFHEHFDAFKDKYNKDIEKLFREFGVMRVEMSLMTEEKKQAKLQPYLQTTSEEKNSSERKIKLNNVEQQFYISELDKFNKENTQRLMYELQTFDEKLDQLKSKYQNYKDKAGPKSSGSPGFKDEWNRLLDETEVIGETYTSLKYQIEGAKKKYFFDIRKIEDNMEKINKIKSQIQDEMRTNSKLAKSIPQEIKVIDEFPDKIKNLIDEINMNLNTAFARLEMVEDKIQENQELLLPKSK